MTSNQNVLIYTAHIKKVIVKLNFFYSEKQNNGQTLTGQKFRLTPVCPPLWLRA